MVPWLNHLVLITCGKPGMVSSRISQVNAHSGFGSASEPSLTGDSQPRDGIDLKILEVRNAMPPHPMPSKACITSPGSNTRVRGVRGEGGRG